MRKKFRPSKLLYFLPLTTLMFCFNAPQDDDEKMKTIMIGVKNTLSYLHYNPKPINDAYSQEVYNQYFEMVDFGKRYFLQSDMEEFRQHYTKLDDYFNSGDLTFYKLTTARLFQRYDEADKITQEILSKPINFNEDETIVLEHDDKKYPANKQEFYNEWKKYVKYNILQEMETLNAKQEAQQKKKDSVQRFKLKDTIKLFNLSEDEKLKRATGEVKDLMSSSFKRLRKRKSMDWFTVYMNAYTEVFDPHSNYFSPKNKEDFDVEFTGKVIGIGAVIQEKKGNLFLGPLSIGAPAYKSKQLNDGDRILKVKSKPDGEDVNVVGMLSDEAVRLIRGKAGTPVTLTVEKKDKSIRVVTMIREEVEREETYAKSIIVNTPAGGKVGYIYLPGFNAEFEKADQGRNASDDIKNELTKLKAGGITSVVLDLRNNGGGSITEVGDIMGLFMNAGPYVQVKDSQGKVQILRNKVNSPVWTGPLAIMQNEFSASASEILAGAMQDYKRAVIVGSPQSFGKGTVQAFVDLNRFLQSSDDFGSVKLTIQKFYRITGESNQRKGIVSDVQMKDFFSYGELGERFDEYALPWDRITSASFSAWPGLNIPVLQAASQNRLKANAFYGLLQEAAQWGEKINEEKSLTVNGPKFFELMKTRKAQTKKYDQIQKYDNGLKFTQNAADAAKAGQAEESRKKADQWVKDLKKDFYLAETINVLKDIK